MKLHYAKYSITAEEIEQNLKIETVCGRLIESRFVTHENHPEWKVEKDLGDFCEFCFDVEFDD